jgi:hypothetical protein
MRPVNSADERAHVRGRAWSGDEDEVSLESFAIETVGVKEIFRAPDQSVCSENRYMQPREQADRASVVMIGANAHRAGSSHSGKRVGDSDFAGRKFFARSSDDHIGQPLARGEKFGREIERPGNRNACALRTASDCQRKLLCGSRQSLDRGGRCCRSIFELRQQLGPDW